MTREHHLKSGERINDDALVRMQLAAHMAHLCTLWQVNLNESSAPQFDQGNTCMLLMLLLISVMVRSHLMRDVSLVAHYM